MEPVAVKDVIRKKLDESRRQVKLLQGGTVALALATFTAVFFSTEIALDSLFLLDRGFRVAAFAVFVLLGATAAVAAVALASRRVSDLYAARFLERQKPELRDALVTVVDLRTGRAEVTEEVRRLLEYRVSRDLYTVSVEKVVGRKLSGLFRRAAIVVLVFAFGSLLVAGSGYPVFLDRAVRPGALVPPPTETRLVRITPGDAHVVVSEPVRVTTIAAGLPPESVRAFLSYETGRWYEVPLAPESGLWAATFPGSQVSYRYFLAAGDTRTDVFRIRVHRPPALLGLQAVVEPPYYTRRSLRKVKGGDLDVLPESRIILTGRPNRPLESAELVFDGGRRLPFTVHGTEKAEVMFSAKNPGTCRIEVADRYGLRDPHPPTLRIHLREDRPPEVNLLRPAPRTELFPGTPMEVLVDVTDDYGLERLFFVYRRRGSEDRQIFMPLESPEGGRLNFTFTVADLGLQVPDSILYWVEAWDGAPESQVGRSPVHVLHFRRRPEEVLKPFESLAEKLRDLASKRETRRNLDLEDEELPELEKLAAKAEERERRLRELLERQREFVKQAEALGNEAEQELQALRNDLREMERELEALGRDTREMMHRGLDQQAKTAASVAQRLERLRTRTRAIRKRLEEKARGESEKKRLEALLSAAHQMARAGEEMRQAAQDAAETESRRSYAHQRRAAKSVQAAREAVDDLLNFEQDGEAWKKAEELARKESEIRKRTEELARELDREKAQALRKASRAMRDAQRSLESGDPTGAQDSAEEALEELSEAEPESEEEREAQEERMEALARVLEQILEDHEEARRWVIELAPKRAQGALGPKDAARLREAGRREYALADRTRRILKDLEREYIGVYRFVLDRIRSDLLDVSDLIVLESRTDAFVQHLQTGVSRRLRELIEALKPTPRPSGGGGGGKAGRPPQVGLEAQLKMLRTMQANLVERSREVRDRCREAKAVDRVDRMILSRIVALQDALREQVAEMARRIRRGPE